MYQNFNNPSYYRAHQFKNQLDLPSGALKNRFIQQHYSQIPQGKQFFQPTSKKHYQTLAHQSQIQQQNLMQEQLTEQDMINSRIAMDRSYFRSLNVDDIEGAKPNTLISKAVKNKQRAHQLKKQQQRAKQHPKTQLSNDGYYQNNKIVSNGSLLNQYEAEKKLKMFKVGQNIQNNSYTPNNFHFSSRNIQKQDTNSYMNNNSNINYQQKYQQSRAKQQDKRIKQLQSQLALQRSRGKILSQQRQFEINNSLGQQQQRRHQNFIQEKIKSYQDNSKRNADNQQYINKMKIHNFQKAQQQLNRQYPSIRQQEMNRQKIMSNPYVQQPKLNSYQQNNPYNNKSIQNLNYRNDPPSQFNMPYNKSVVFDDKTSYRKYNPTFLSYGSTNGISPISLAGKNIVNQ